MVQVEAEVSTIAYSTAAVTDAGEKGLVMLSA